MHSTEILKIVSLKLQIDFICEIKYIYLFKIAIFDVSIIKLWVGNEH